MELEEAVPNFDVEEYVGGFGKVRRSNKTNLSVAPCPLCGDRRRDKFYVNAAGDTRNGAFNTYCCHEQGNLVRLLQMADKLSVGEAIRKIISTVEAASMFIPIVKPSVAPKSAPTVTLPQPFTVATPETPMIFRGKQITLRDRGIDEWTIARNLLVVTGPIATYQGKMFPLYANRLIAPIFGPTPDKPFMSWQGRDLTEQSPSKYVQPHDINIKTTFYGWHEAQGLEFVLIFEGTPAKWSCDSFMHRILGVNERFPAIASLGKHLSDHQIDLLLENKSIKRVTLAWDTDAAVQMQKAAEKLAGRKELSVILPAQDGRGFDELDDFERAKFIASAQPFNLSLMVKLNALKALKA